MAMRITPEQYLNQQQFPYYPRAEVQEIPTWVPILLGIALIGAFAVAIYALSKK